MKKSYAFAAVKSLDSENPNGEFEVVLSAATVDRDGEVIEARAFERLPESIPFHAFHDFHDPIGRGVPFYDGDVLKARGVYASTPRAQEIRTLVAEGIIGHTSVGFMGASRKDGEDGIPHITSGELLEGSFVSVPSNREAAVLMAKSFDAYLKVGSRNSSKDAERLQAIHDLAVDNGATCASKSAAVHAVKAFRSAGKCHGMSANTLRERLSDAVREAHPDDYPWVRDYSDEWVVYEVYGSSTVVLWQESYEVREGTPLLSGGRIEVHAEITYTPKTSTEAPATPDDESGKSLASEVVAAALTRARLTLLATE